jgi:hypothetical protein
MAVTTCRPGRLSSRRVAARRGHPPTSGWAVGWPACLPRSVPASVASSAARRRRREAPATPTAAAIDDGMAPCRSFPRLGVVERQSSPADDDDAGLGSRGQWHGRGLGLIFGSCRATRCRNSSLKWRKRSTRAPMNWWFCVPARSPAVVGAEALPQIACTLRSVDVCSAWMGGCLQ